MARLALAALVAVILVIAAPSCFSGTDREVTYENGTAYTLEVTLDGDKLTRLKPGESEAFRTRKELMPDRLKAFDEGGRLRCQMTVTWDYFKANGFKVVITESQE